MDLILNTKNIEKLESTNVQKIANLMENKTFRSFYNEFSNSWQVWQDILFMMRLYEYIEKQQPMLNKKQKIALIVYIMKNTEIRHKIIQNYMNEQLRIC